MFCQQCGSTLADDAKFCDYCGAPQDAVTSQQPLDPVSGYGEATSPEKKKSKLPLILIGAVVLIAVVVLCVVLFGKQTVYLLTEQNYSYADGDQNIQTWEYDEDGRLLSHTYRYEHEDSDYRDSYMETTYEFNDDGQLELIEIVSGYTDEDEKSVIEVEYSYDKKGILEDVEVSSDSDYDYDVRIDDDGRIEKVVSTREGYEIVYRYSYYDDGNLESYKYVLSYTDEDPEYSYEYYYDEEGRKTECCRYEDDELSYKTTYEYEEDLSQPVKTTDIHYEDGEEFSRNVQEYEFVKDGDQIMEVVREYQKTDSDGNSYSAKIVYEFEWDDLEAEVTVAKATGDLDIWFSYDLELWKYELEFDEQGNLLRKTHIEDGEVRYSYEYEYEYEKFRVSRDYDENYLLDPIYSLTWCR